MRSNSDRNSDGCLENGSVYVSNTPTKRSASSEACCSKSGVGAFGVRSGVEEFMVRVGVDAFMVPLVCELMGAKSNQIKELMKQKAIK